MAWASLGTTVLCNVHAGMTPRDAVTTAVRHINALQVRAPLSSKALPSALRVFRICSFLTLSSQDDMSIPENEADDLYFVAGAGLRFQARGLLVL